jgi:ribonuclease-3
VLNRRLNWEFFRLKGPLDDLRSSTAQPSLGYDFRNPELFLRAITHRSFHNENSSSSPGHNERLEYLGDAILDLILSEKLFLDHPSWSEGELSKVRSSLANEHTLAEVAKQMDLGAQLRFGRGETQTGGALKPRLLACGFEALVAAVYLDSDYPTVRDYILRLFGERITSLHSAEVEGFDFKTRLQETMQEKFKKTPIYELVGEEGPDHDKVFTVQVKLADRTLAEGQGKSKKQAEQDAASKALKEI